MNDIYRRSYTLEFDVWDAQKKVTLDELDKLMFDLKNKILLPHAGNVKLTPVAEVRLSNKQ